MRHSYPSSLNYHQLAPINDLFPPPHSRGRPLVPSRLSILNAILDVIRSGGSWRMLPHEFAPWQTVYGYFRRWQRAGLWERHP